MWSGGLEALGISCVPIEDVFGVSFTVSIFNTCRVVCSLSRMCWCAWWAWSNGPVECGVTFYEPVWCSGCAVRLARSPRARVSVHEDQGDLWRNKLVRAPTYQTLALTLRDDPLQGRRDDTQAIFSSFVCQNVKILEKSRAARAIEMIVDHPNSGFWH